jgi:hypothetical protein
MQKLKARTAGIVAWPVSIFLVALAALLTAHPAAAETYNVTETDCGAATNGLLWAIEQANANGGPDSIEIAAGLEITGCPIPRNSDGLVLSDESSLVITDDLTIEGNGATYNGNNLRVNASGFVDLVNRDCKLAGGQVLGREYSLLRIGEFDTDNSGLEVTIEDLTVKRVSQIAAVRDGAKLTLRDVTGLEVTDMILCSRGAIEAYGTADLVLEEVHLEGLSSYVENNTGSSIRGGSGKLEMYDSSIRRAVTGHAVIWVGDADIVSSFFADAGGLEQVGPGTMRVVNSLIWPNASVTGMRSSDISWVTSTGGELQFEASTVLYQALNCGRFPKDNCYLQPYPYDGALQAYPGSSMSFKESIAHVQVVDANVNTFPFPLLSDNAKTIFADEFTFMQPLPWQTDIELESITGQFSLRTAPPALEVGFNIPFPENVTPLLNGVANDQISDAGPGGANELKDPRGDTITHDVLGNPRTDEGLRSIGAVQNSLVPHLTVLGTGDGRVELLSTTPRDLDPITGYRFFYRVKGTTNWASTDSLSTIGDITGLSNGTAYEFQVDTLVNGSPAGYPSSIVTATPPSSGDVLDCSVAYPSPDSLWPPNHKLVPIAVLGINESHGHPVTLSIDGVFQDEPVNGKADGNTRPDATGIGSSTASVRAERAGNGNGRVYTINFTALSDGGAQCKGSVEVGVPHDPMWDAVNDGPLFNSVFD